MRVRHRIDRLERTSPRLRPSDRDHGRGWNNLTEEEWATHFEAWAEAGGFAGVPEFPAAWEKFRLRLAECEADPCFHEPPVDFLPSRADGDRLRVWRRDRFPRLNDAVVELLDILVGMGKRCTTSEASR